MAGENSGCGGWGLIIGGIVEGALVSSWAGAFASTDGAASPHFYWYVELPLVFLAAPVVAIVAGIYLVRRRTRNGPLCSEIAVGAAGILLVINLLLFLGYAMLSGGGV